MLKKASLIVIVLLVLIFAIVKLPSYIHPQKEDYLIVSGRVEADEVRLSTQIQGKLKELYIDDGASVKEGDIIALIDDEELQSKRRELIHSIEELEERIAAAEISLEYMKKDINRNINEAEKMLSIARARLRQAEAKKAKAENEYKRYLSLLMEELISRDEFESIELAYKVALEDINTATEDVERAEISLVRAKDSKSLIDVEEKELASLNRSLDGLKERLTQIEINIGYTKITAPSEGIILKKVAEAGEIIPRGGVLGILINPERVYVKTFVPERYIGMVTLNMETEVISDAYRDRAIYGYICHIADRAEFTPKEVQSYEERVKQVFAVKVCFEKGDKEVYKILKKGMPVDVRFQVKSAQS